MSDSRRIKRKKRNKRGTDTLAEMVRSRKKYNSSNAEYRQALADRYKKAAQP